MNLTYEEQVYLRLLMHDTWFTEVKNRSDSDKKLHKAIHQKLSQELSMPKTKSKTHKRYGVTLTWEESISKQLVGRKIVEVRWMTKEEALWLADKFYDIYYA